MSFVKTVPPIRYLASAMLLGVLAFAPVSLQIHAQITQSATQSLLDKAHALEVRGRLDMASQTWQQVLLADPQNAEALGGLARAAKFSGNTALANTYLDRLRAINPNDPNIARVENMGTQQNQSAALKQAGKLAEAGQYDQAMSLYRQVFGTNPPAGDWALAYYETESATDSGRTHAIAGLRALMEKFPSDSRYQVALGRILTYNPKTREEGRRLLEKHPNDPQAAAALRQSLVWDAANPASAADIRAYLAKHNDAQLATALRNQPKPPPSRGPAAAPQSPEEIAANAAARARGVEEQEAFNALNAKRIDDAELRFKAILANDPQNARALSGMGYVRMQQSNFGGAISFLEQAKQNGGNDTGLNTALETSRFYYTMSEGSTALNENDLPTAEQQYQAALNMRPNSAEALEGLGGTLLKAQQFEASIEVFERYAKTKPSASAAWRGLFMAYYGAGNAPQALLTERRIPPAVRSQLMRDPEFLRSLASAYSAVGRDADAQRVLHSALDLPFPPGARGLKVETQLQYASLLQQANRLDQAGALFRQVLASDVSNTAAWQGLVRVQHAMKADPQALQTLQSMPPSSYETAMRDPGFQTTVAAIYQSQNRLDAAQDLLEKSVNQQLSANQKPSTAVMLQLAGIYLSRNNADKAFPIYRQVLTDNPERTDAWKGLLSVLHSSGRDQEALAQVQQIPQATRRQLEEDVDYLQTIGSVYNALGQPQQAMVFLNRVQQHYAIQHTSAPADVDVQDAWLLFNGGNDAGLYRQLMLLGGRQDLTDEQRRTVQTIWTNWAVRRANQAAASGNIKRSLAILNAAAKSFPDNPGVLRALASGYARAGLPKQAVLIFKAQDMTAASASDYKSAVGAALAAGDTKIAETWLRYGLDSYPKDAEMLNLGARFEQARGDSGRAAEYYRASLAALPPGDPGAELANELSQPLPVTRLPTPAQPQDLATLLRESSTDSLDTAPQPQPPARPYLPNYGNYYGQAPVQVPSSGPYNGTSSVVPSYMANPAARAHQSSTRLGDYSPQAATGQPDPLGGVGLPPAQTSFSANNNPSYSPTTPQGDSTYQDFMRKQSQQSNQQAQLHQPITALPQQDTYGPYVPYVPQSQNYGYTPSPVPVQLGDNTPHAVPPQREVTDVLPTARYVPNARANRSKSHSGPILSGQSNPPPDDYNTAATQNTQYGGQSQTYSTIPSTPPTSGDSYGQQYPQPGVTSNSSSRRRTQPSSGSQAAAAPLPSLAYPGVGQPLSGPAYPVIGPEVPAGVPPTDAELAAKNLPPLRGGYDPRGPIVPGQPLSQRAQTEQDLLTLESSYSGWIGGIGYGRYRSGTAGFDRLTDLEAPFEASAVLGKTLRATIIPRPVFLNSGTIDSTAFQNATGTVPVLGTLSGAALTPPAQQFASGIGGEFQLTTQNMGLAVGYTPYGFLVTNVTGRVRWRPFGGHFTLFGERDSVKDTQLSYAGLRDPGTTSAIFDGNIWGGVISTGGGARIDIGSEKSGLYVSGDGSDITGFHVLENRKFEGSMGSYFRVKVWPGYGSLNIGASFFGMHYDFNERGLTYGQGGYFSPNVYFLAAVPVTFNGYYKTDFHYSINGSVGLQTFQEDKAPFYPLDQPLEVGSANAQFPLNSNTGFNYALNMEGSYRIADHWYVGGFISGNNTNNYNTVSGGFSVRYLFKPQFPTETTPAGLFPSTGFRPLRVP
jgi:cellulose synthase operon protein C